MLRRKTMRAFTVLGAILLILSPAAAGASETADAEPDVNDFDYSSWDARYELSLDDEGRAVMHVVETLVADFPDFDQNRGIVYGITTDYQGSMTGTEILSVTNESGEPVPYETESEDGLVYVLTGDDDYVHGPQTYVIEYEMHDTMLAAGNGSDEFYWNLLPLNSTQDVASFHAEIAFSSELSDALTGNALCYTGRAGDRTSCDMTGPERTANGTQFRVEGSSLAAGVGVTVAVGFESGTVTQPFARTGAALPVNAAVIALSAAGALTATGGAFAMGAHVRKRRRATGVIVAQYDVPGHLPPLIAGPLLRTDRPVVPAQMVHLAVSNALRIEEIPSKKSDKRRIQLRLRPAPPLGDELDQQALDALFKKANVEGVTLIPKNSSGFAKRMERLAARGEEAAVARGFITKERVRSAGILQWIAIAFSLAGIALLIATAVLGQSPQPAVLLVAIAAGGIALLFSIVNFSAHRMLTPEGATWYEYLMGVREFIRVAEEDRIRMLQSASGAERRADGSIDVVHLYERLLPYAMLFGQEKEWGEVLETNYDSDGIRPDWYRGTSPTSFAASFALFSSATHSATTYTAPSSSGAGGSMGGGFSGGGGGGGFSGGR